MEPWSGREWAVALAIQPVVLCGRAMEWGLRQLATAVCWWYVTLGSESQQAEWRAILAARPRE